LHEGRLTRADREVHRAAETGGIHARRLDADPAREVATAIVVLALVVVALVVAPAARVDTAQELGELLDRARVPLLAQEDVERVGDLSEREHGPAVMVVATTAVAIVIPALIVVVALIVIAFAVAAHDGKRRAHEPRAQVQLRGQQLLRG